LTDITTIGSAALTFQFTDPAFAGLEVLKSSDNFPGGLTLTTSGNTLTITSHSLAGLPGNWNAVYTLMSPAAVPEPSQFTLAGVAGLVLADRVVYRRRCAA
jgi:hypothetical protein